MQRNRCRRLLERTRTPRSSNTIITNFMVVWSGINPHIRSCPTIPPDDDHQKDFCISEFIGANESLHARFLFPYEHVRSGYLWTWRWDECKFESPLYWSEKLTQERTLHCSDILRIRLSSFVPVTFISSWLARTCRMS